jgi:integrase
MGVIVRQKTKGKRKVGDKRAAKKVASEIQAKLQLGEFGFEQDKPVHSFKHYADAWINNTVPATCKISTTSDYQAILDKHVLPVFGALKVNGVTEGKIKDFLFSKVNADYAASTITHMKNVISGVLAKAIDDKTISENATLNLGKQFMKKITDAIEARKVANGDEKKGEPDPLSGEELKLLLDAVDAYFPEHYPLFLLLARTGVRIGEALGLQWGDIDFNSRFLNLQRSLSRGSITTLKGKRGRRVDMSWQLADALKAHLIRSKEKGMKLGLGEHPEYVFTDSKCGFIALNNWRKRVFWKVLVKAKLRRIRIHDLRHTYATLRISKGDNIADVSNQLGHFSETFTMKIYYHWMPGKKKSEVDELDDADFRYREKISDENRMAT